MFTELDKFCPKKTESTTPKAAQNTATPRFAFVKAASSGGSFGRLTRERSEPEVLLKQHAGAQQRGALVLVAL